MIKVLITKVFSERIKKLLLESNGIEFIEFPTIEVIPIDFEIDLDNYSTVIITSSNAAEIFINSLFKVDLVKLSEKRLAATGMQTAYILKQFGFDDIITPRIFSSKYLIEKFDELDIRNEKILVPGSELMGTNLKEGLEKLGNKVEVINTYNVVTKKYSLDDLEKIFNPTPYIFAFTSPSSYKSFNELARFYGKPDILKGKVIGAIGTTTETEILDSGMKVDLVPKEFTMQSLVETIINKFGENN